MNVTQRNKNLKCSVWEREECSLNIRRENIRFVLRKYFVEVRQHHSLHTHKQVQERGDFSEHTETNSYFRMLCVGNG